MVDYNSRYCTLTNEGVVLLDKFKRETGTTGNIENVTYDGGQFVEVSFVGADRKFYINVRHVDYIVD